MAGDPEPFWNAAFRADRQPFGPPAVEILELADRLPRRASVLDLGCGDGRNALPLARAGHRVTAVDTSVAALESLRRAALREAAGADPGAPLGMQLIHADLADMGPLSAHGYDLIIAHGILHLLALPDRDRLIDRMRRQTRPGGWNVIAAFTNAISPPEDMAHLCRGLFEEGELFQRYGDWRIELESSYVLEDEHPGGIRHRHAINKLVARRPGAEGDDGRVGPGDRPESGRRADRSGVTVRGGVARSTGSRRIRP